jgi:hypothetical protein
LLREEEETTPDYHRDKETPRETPLPAPEYYIRLKRISDMGTPVSALKDCNTPASNWSRGDKPWTGEPTVARMARLDQAQREEEEKQAAGEPMEDETFRFDTFNFGNEQEDPGVLPAVSVTTDTVLGEGPFDNSPIVEREMDGNETLDAEKREEVNSWINRILNLA